MDFKTEDRTPFSEVYVWGNDAYGQLGLGNDTALNVKRDSGKENRPRRCGFDVAIAQVSCGEEHSAFVTQAGDVYAMGSNLEGRLGIGDRSCKFAAIPRLLESFAGTKIRQISCGWGHTAAVSADGNLFAWGYGGEGQLGLGSTGSEYSPKPVKISGVVRAVSCGARHTAVTTTDSSVFMFGNGEKGQLGTGRSANEVVPTRLSCFPDGISQVACGITHTLFLGSSGGVWSCGGNLLGQLGHGSKKSCSAPLSIPCLEKLSVRKLAAGYHSAALTHDGELYLWGTGSFGELLSPQLLKTFAGRKVSDVAIASTFSLALDPEGKVYSWGSNNHGELSLGDFAPRAEPTEIEALIAIRINQIACGGSHAIVLMDDNAPQSGKLEVRTELSPIIDVQSLSAFVSPIAAATDGDILISRTFLLDDINSVHNLTKKIESLEHENRRLKEDLNKKDLENERLRAKINLLEMSAAQVETRIVQMTGARPTTAATKASGSEKKPGRISHREGHSPLTRRTYEYDRALESYDRGTKQSDDLPVPNAIQTRWDVSSRDSRDAGATFAPPLPVPDAIQRLRGVEKLLDIRELGSHQACEKLLGDGKGLSESIRTIKTKLNDLHKNKEVLEQRMRDFERKITVSTEDRGSVYPSNTTSLAPQKPYY